MVANAYYQSVRGKGSQKHSLVLAPAPALALALALAGESSKTSVYILERM